MNAPYAEFALACEEVVRTNGGTINITAIAAAGREFRRLDKLLGMQRPQQRSLATATEAVEFEPGVMRQLLRGAEDLSYEGQRT